VRTRVECVPKNNHLVKLNRFFSSLSDSSSISGASTPRAGQLDPSDIMQMLRKRGPADAGLLADGSLNEPRSGTQSRTQLRTIVGHSSHAGVVRLPDERGSEVLGVPVEGSVGASDPVGATRDLAASGAAASESKLSAATRGVRTRVSDRRNLVTVDLWEHVGQPWGCCGVVVGQCITFPLHLRPFTVVG